MNKYRLLSKKGEGTFSEVLKAQSIASQRYVAIKCMKKSFESVEQVNQLREIQALRKLGGHPHVIRLHEVLFDMPTGRLALVFELMDLNLYEAIRGRRQYLPEGKVKRMMYQVLKALEFMNRNGIFHRDIKPENILVSSSVPGQVQLGGSQPSALPTSSGPGTAGGQQGGGPQGGGQQGGGPQGDAKAALERWLASGGQSSSLTVKVADFGSCRGIYSPQPYTEYISTRWYRAPECLITSGMYSWQMDAFALGCVWFEVLALFPLFPGTNEQDQIERIHSVLGSPTPEMLQQMQAGGNSPPMNFPEKRGSGIARLIPHVSSELTRLLKQLLAYAPESRLQARQALQAGYFREVVEETQPAEEARSAGSAHASGGSAARTSAAENRSENGNRREENGSGRTGASRASSPQGSASTSTLKPRDVSASVRQAQGRHQVPAAHGTLAPALIGSGRVREAAPKLSSTSSGHQLGALPPISGSGTSAYSRGRQPGSLSGSGGASVRQEKPLGSTLTRFSNGRGLGVAGGGPPGGPGPSVRAGAGSLHRKRLGNQSLLATHSALGYSHGRERSDDGGGRAPAASLGVTQGYRGRKAGSLRGAR